MLNPFISSSTPAFKDNTAVDSATDESALNELVPIEVFLEFIQGLWVWVDSELLVFNVALQLIAVLAAFVPAMIFGPRIRKMINQKIINHIPEGKGRSIVNALAILGLPIALYLSLHIISVAFASGGVSTQWLDAAIALLSAWIIVRLVTLVIKSPFWSKVAFYIAWPVAALDAFGALGPVIDQLQAFGVPLGKDEQGNAIKISVLDVLRTLLYFAVLFWVASFISKIAERQLENIDELNPALKALITKVLNILLPIIALIIALQVAGFNLATLAVFSGAVGLGLGLGLQRIVANFVAGFTLIADRSIKPKDTIEIDGVMGWVTGMHSRYVALRTRDGTEILIPNDRFMGEGVINWSRSDHVVRQHAEFGVSYSTSNLNLIQELAVKVATEVERVVHTPQPICNLVAFGDSSVNFDLCYWIADPQNGLANVKSEVLMKVWDMLKENNIEIPFPQRDLHLKTSEIGRLT